MKNKILYILVVVSASYALALHIKVKSQPQELKSCIEKSRVLEDEALRLEMELFDLNGGE